MAVRASNPNFMNGVPELLILRLLKHKEMYGYEIVQAIRNRSDAVISVGEGVVYRCCTGWNAMGRYGRVANLSMAVAASTIPLRREDRVVWPICRRFGPTSRVRSNRF